MGHDCCCVVNCKNNGLNSKCKFYIFPRASYKIEQRRKWIAAVNRKNADGTQWSPKPHDKICSEHFIGGKKSEEQLSPSYVPTIFPTTYRKKKVNQSQLPNDMQNYMRYHIMGSVPKVLMKSGCVPTKFECQQGKTKRLSDTAERSSVSKKSKKVLMDEKDIVKQSTTTTQLEFSGSSWHSPVQEQEVEVKIENTEEYLIEAEENYQFESVQVDERFHDKEVQTKPELADKLVETWPVQSRSKAVQVNAPPEITVMELVKKETEKMMVRVYKYLCEELEVMKLMSAEEVMIGLEQVSSRAAHATGVSDLTMQRVLEEHQIKTPQQPQNKRKRRKKRNNSHSLEMQRTEEAIASAAVFIPEAVERSDMEVDCAGDRSMDEALVWLKVEVDDSGGDTTDSAPEVELKIIKDEPVSDDLNDTAESEVSRLSTH
ncbi:unnamed protein product [Spodoptera exigua]|nr:unnamed protein product [Spodoptera exigua]